MEYRNGDIRKQLKDKETESDKCQKEEQSKFDEWAEKVLQRFYRVE